MKRQELVGADALDPLAQAKAKAVARVTARFSNDEDVFVSCLYADLRTAISSLERSKGSRHSNLKREKEERITHQIAVILEGIGWDVATEPDHNGHVDIRVQSVNRRLVWIAEAKRHQGSKKLEEGLRQLFGYFTGRELHAGFLVYIQTKNPGRAVRSWRDHLASTKACDLVEISPADDVDSDSVSLHARSLGGHVKIRHFSVLLG